MRRTSLLLLCLLAVAVPACEPVAGPADRAAVPPQSVAQGHDDWGPAVRVTGSIQLNTPALEGCPNESPDGRSLFFASNRGGNTDVYVSRRHGNGDWGDPEQLPPNVNSAANDYCPTALEGGVLLFVSERNDGLNCGSGKADIYITREHPVSGWSSAQHLGCEINSPANEFAPSYVDAGGGMLFFSSDRSGTHNLYVSRRGPGGDWQTPIAVDELNFPGKNTVRPNVSHDGREIVFDSDRPGSTGNDIWYSWRASPQAAWSEPIRLSNAVNSAAAETRASLSRDGKRLYFGSNRDGVSSDLFVSERQ